MCPARDRAHLYHQRSQDPKFVFHSSSLTTTDSASVADVARNMGPVFTEGAIVQHLAKLRNKMDEDNTRDDLQLPVPGKVGRGTVTKPASRAYAKPVPKVNGVPKFAEVSDMNEEELAAADAQRAAKIKGKGKRTKKEMSDDDTAVDDIPTLYDSDADYDASSTKRTRKARKTTTKKEKSVSPKAESKLEIDSGEEAPVMQTRGIRRNYAQMEGRAEEAAAKAIARKSNNAGKAQVKTADKAFVNAGEVKVAADTSKVTKSAAQVTTPAKSAKVVKSFARVDDADKVRESIEPKEFSGAGGPFDDSKLDPRVSLALLHPSLIMLIKLTGRCILHGTSYCSNGTRLGSLRLQRLRIRFCFPATHDEHAWLRSACSVGYDDLPSPSLWQL